MAVETEILKAKIVDDALEIKCRKTKGEDVWIVEESHKAEVHPDLRNAFKFMGIHMAILADYVKAKQVKKISEYDSALAQDFSVTGFSIGGKEGQEGVILSGFKTTPSGKVIILNTPFTRLEEDEDTAYPFIEHLVDRLNHAKEEVKLYTGGKHAPKEQQELEFPEDEPVESR